MVRPHRRAVTAKAAHEAAQVAPVAFVDASAVARDAFQHLRVRRGVRVRAAQVNGESMTPPGRGRQVRPCRRPGWPGRTSGCSFEVGSPLNQGVMTTQVSGGHDNDKKHDDADYRQRQACGPGRSARPPKIAREGSNAHGRDYSASVRRSRNALKITSRDTPMSAAMAAHRDVLPPNVRNTNSALTPSDSAMFCRMIVRARREW